MLHITILISKMTVVISGLMRTLFRPIILLLQYLKRLQIEKAPDSWYISNNFNYYNPILKATVFGTGNNWSIARYGQFINGFPTKKQAMDKAFLIWLDEIGEKYNIQDREHTIVNPEKLERRHIAIANVKDSASTPFATHSISWILVLTLFFAICGHIFF